MPLPAPPPPVTKPPNRFAGCIQGCVVTLVVLVGVAIYIWWSASKHDKADKERAAMLAEFKPFTGAGGPPADAADDAQARYRKGHLIVLGAGSGKFDEFLFSLLPDTLKATSAGDVDTEVWVKTDFQLVGKYDNGGNAYRTNYDLIVYDVARKAVVAREHIEGDDPPKTIRVRSGSDDGWNTSQADKIIKFLQALPAR